MEIDAGSFFMFIFVTATEGNILTVPVHHQYHYVGMLKTWTEAQSYCRSHYVDLATVDNMEEHQAVLKFFSVNDYGSVVWLGLRRSSVWSWGWSDGARAEDWALSRVADLSSGGDCVWMGPEGDWNSGHCNEQRASLCYKIENGAVSYVLNPSALTWRGAQSSCRGSYKDLVTVRTPEQTQNLLGATEGSSVWIGLFRDEWAWSDQTPRAFRIWDQWNPDNYGGPQNCLSLRLQYREWDTLGCEAKLHFLCYTATWKTMFNIKLSMKVAVSHVQKPLQEQIQKLFKGDDFKLTMRSAMKLSEHNATKTGC